MGKLVLLLLYPFTIFCFDATSIVNDEVSLFNQIHSKESQNTPIIEHFSYTNFFDELVKNKKSGVHPDFAIPSYFHLSTKFWFTIYTQVESHKLLVHDKENVRIIYELINFEKLKNGNVTYHQRLSLQPRLSKKRVQKIKQELKLLSENKLNRKRPFTIDVFMKEPISKYPRVKKKEKSFLKEELKNLGHKQAKKILL